MRWSQLLSDINTLHRQHRNLIVSEKIILIFEKSEVQFVYVGMVDCDNTSSTWLYFLPALSTLIDVALIFPRKHEDQTVHVFIN